jgi:nickel-dependent lactate racemase
VGLGAMPRDSRAVVDGLGLEDHALAAAEGAVVDGAVTVVGEGAEVVGADLDGPVAMARLRMPWSSGPAKKLGKMVRMSKRMGAALTDVLPALGTHKAMSDREIATMFGGVSRDLFRVHDWRNDVVTLGEVPGEFMLEVSEGKLDYTWPAQVNKLVRDGGHDLILSIGQVVPHEVVGMANGNKNIFVGTGGTAGIHRSHFLGAVYGMERMMGRAETPVRRVLNYASEHFAKELPIVYVQTVVAKNAKGELVLRGMFVGDDAECFREGGGA